ncbi:MAG: hypothetical protein U0234_00715 [Sandaracinus sp.]
MATTLTVPDLRGLAKLYRRGVEGAREQLAAIIGERVAELPRLLGFPPANVTRLREHEDPVEVLVATIEGAPRVAREARMRAENERARALAAELGSTLVVDAEGTVDVDLSTIATIIELGDHRHVSFGERGAVETRRLRALLRECRRVSACSALLRESTLDVVYETARSRGIVRLHLQPAGAGVDVVLVPVTERTRVALPEVVAPIVEATTAPIATAPLAARAPARTQPRRSQFASHFIEALVAAAFGGAR